MTRAIILKCVVLTAFAGLSLGQLKQWAPAERDEFFERIEQRRLEALRGLEPLRWALTPWEQAYFKAAPSSLSARLQTDGMWRIESLQVLLWALTLLDMLPPYGSLASGDILDRFPESDQSTAIPTATLRPIETIERERDVAELWHWRSRTRELIERGHPFQGSLKLRDEGLESYDDIVRMVAVQASNDGMTTLVDDDFSAKEKAFRDLTDDEWSELRSIITERHFALNWLCGLAPSNRWDETPTDT